MKVVAGNSNREGVIRQVREIGDDSGPRRVVSLKPHLKNFSDLNANSSSLALVTTQDASGALNKFSERSFST